MAPYTQAGVRGPQAYARRVVTQTHTDKLEAWHRWKAAKYDRCLSIVVFLKTIRTAEELWTISTISTISTPSSRNRAWRLEKYVGVSTALGHSYNIRYRHYTVCSVLNVHFDSIFGTFSACNATVYAVEIILISNEFLMRTLPWPHYDTYNEINFIIDWIALLFRIPLG